MKQKIKKYLKKLFKLLSKPEMAILPSNIAFNLILAIIPILTIIVLMAGSFDISIELIEELVRSMMPKEVSETIIEVISGKGFDRNIGISNIIAFVQQVGLSIFYSPKKVIAQQMVDETVVRRSKENTTKLRVENEKK